MLKVKYLHNIPEINAGLSYLIHNDVVFNRLNPDLNEFTWPYYGPGFESLCRIVCGQQVSTSAAKSIWNKFDHLISDKSPENINLLNEEDLKACGLSYRKAGYIKGLALQLVEGQLDLDHLEYESDENVINVITSLKGFGPWSAELYLMFCLARPDIWPAGDLGIQSGLQKYLDMTTRPNEKQVRCEQIRFSPHSTAAALLLWHLNSKKTS